MLRLRPSAVKGEGGCVGPRAAGRSRLLANQSQHVPTPLEARPPDRVVPGRIALQAKRGIVREQRTHRFDAAAAEHRAVRSVDRAGRDRTRQRRDSAFAFDGGVCSVGEQQIDERGIGIARRQQQRRRRLRAGARDSDRRRDREEAGPRQPAARGSRAAAASRPSRLPWVRAGSRRRRSRGGRLIVSSEPVRAAWISGESGPARRRRRPRAARRRAQAGA